VKKIRLKNYTQLSKEEHQELLAIRNSDAVLESSFTEKKITLAEHLSWVESLKNTQDREYYCVFYNEAIVGGLNIFDRVREAKWGLFFQTQTPLIIKSLAPLFFMEYIFTKLKVKTLYSEIKNSNLNAISFNESLGFTLVDSQEIVRMKLTQESFRDAKSAFLLKKVIKKMSLYDIEIEGTQSL